MANNFIPRLDRMTWVQVSPSPNAHAAGTSLCCDLRNDTSVNPYIGFLVGATTLNKYNVKTKAWSYQGSAALAGTFGAGATTVFAPSRSLYGTIAAGATTTSVILSTALAAAVGVNQLANKGDGYGFRIRITGNTAGGSGKTEEREIIGNTSGTTPKITVDSAFSFTPANGDAYEILAGKYYGLSASTLASGVWKSFESATNYVATLGYTNLPATIGTDSYAIALDELYVPYDHKPGEGFVIGVGTYDTSGTAKFCLTATATAAGTITGETSAGDYALLENEYRNFQIRVVQDTATPTAVGQRRMIASHTAGPNPVYTLGSNWSVQPSATAKYVIEYPNVIFIRSSANTTVYTYNYSGATINNGTNTIANDAWSTAYFGSAANNCGAGVMLFPSFGIEPDTAKNARHSFIYCFRGGGSASLDLFDIAGGTTGAWSAAITYDGSWTNSSYVTTGACGEYAPFCCEGRWAYMNMYIASAINQIFRFDVKNRILEPFTPTDWIQSGTAAVGDRLVSFPIINGTDKYTGLLLQSHLSTISQELVVQA